MESFGNACTFLSVVNCVLAVQGDGRRLSVVRSSWSDTGSAGGPNERQREERRREGQGGSREAGGGAEGSGRERSPAARAGRTALAALAETRAPAKEPLLSLPVHPVPHTLPGQFAAPSATAPAPIVTCSMPRVATAHTARACGSGTTDRGMVATWLCRSDAPARDALRPLTRLAAPAEGRSRAMGRCCASSLCCRQPVNRRGSSPASQAWRCEAPAAPEKRPRRDATPYRWLPPPHGGCDASHHDVGQRIRDGAGRYVG